MKKSINCRKTEQLGINPSTAYNRLKKKLMFQMVQLLDMDWCFQCGAQIETEEELSVEHTIPWLDSENPREVFFDTSNILFSHRSCNCSAARRPTFIPCPSSSAYGRGCRCDGCRTAQSKYRKNLRDKKRNADGEV